MNRIQRIPDHLYWDTPRPQFREPILLYAARRMPALAGILLGFGFFAVFVEQANILLQIVLGAPIFEEFLKFGLALLIVSFRKGWFNSYALFGRVIVALLVGSGFGVLEHYVTYVEESSFSYATRIAFHGLSTALSMICLHILLPLRDARTRYLAPSVSIILHYINNVAAVMLASFGGLGFNVSTIISAAVILTLLAMCMVIPLIAKSFAEAARKLSASIFPRMPPHWENQVRDRVMYEVQI